MEMIKPSSLDELKAGKLLSADDLLSGSTVVNVFMEKERDWSTKVRSAFELASYKLEDNSDSKDQAFDFIAIKGTDRIAVKAYRLNLMLDDFTARNILMPMIERKKNSKLFHREGNDLELWVIISKISTIGNGVLEDASDNKIRLLTKDKLYKELTKGLKTHEANLISSELGVDVDYLT